MYLKPVLQRGWEQLARARFHARYLQYRAARTAKLATGNGRKKQVAAATGRAVYRYT